MPTIQQAVETAVGPLVTPLVLKSILNTLQDATQEAGSLDVLRVQMLVDQVASGLKVFNAKFDDVSLRKLKAQLSMGALPAPATTKLTISSDADVVIALRQCQVMTRRFFTATDVVRINTAVSELARNAHMYAGHGDLTLTLSEHLVGYSMAIVISDEGPGIPAHVLEMTGKYVSKTGLGRGLIGTRALLDEFNIESQPGRTVIRGLKRSRHQ